VAVPEGMLFGELAEAEDDWLWCSDMAGNKPELGLGYFGRLVVEKAKNRMESIGGGERGCCCDRTTLEMSGPSSKIQIG
jgi:hypothetical protein